MVFLFTELDTGKWVVCDCGVGFLGVFVSVCGVCFFSPPLFSSFICICKREIQKEYGLDKYSELFGRSVSTSAFVFSLFFKACSVSSMLKTWASFGNLISCDSNMSFQPILKCGQAMCVFSSFYL